ncbi:hypothetical protein OG429_01105 [Streptomyces sp. NBC_00190]|uniref:hypothetical protein n=1 Tax=unclassified Streptomyces TaxID=2593676 RepID=UPI002E28B4E7|nr:hypothetical protein [Streptomyces sp. NBC_00190]WSZ38061.1 hypothetical protein OG239_04095 [Streptomyces sp. NBC_00868]
MKKTLQVNDQIRETAQQAVRLVKDKTPDPVLDEAAEASRQARRAAVHAVRLATEKTPEPVLAKASQAMAVARANRAPLLAVGAATAILLLVRRSRARK